MYGSSDFEHLFICYKSESMSQGEFLQSFCLHNKIPYNLFQKWYKDAPSQISSCAGLRLHFWCRGGCFRAFSCSCFGDFIHRLGTHSYFG